MWEQIKRLLAPIENKILLMIAKSIIKKVTEGNSQLLATVDLGHGEEITNVELLQQFGFVSIPKNGSEAITLCIGGDRSHPIVINTDDSNERIQVGEGNTGIYNASDIKITLIGNTAHISADVINLGDTVQKLVNETFLTLFNVHTHTGVSSGSSATGTPLPQMTSTNLTNKVKAE